MATAATFDPTQIAPAWEDQRNSLMRIYNQNLINLNLKKNQTLSQQGLLPTQDYNTSGNIPDFGSLNVDPNSQFGGYRNELKSEADMLDAAQGGPDRGFGVGGGVSNQASRAAQQAVGARQSSYQQSLQQTLGNFNNEASNDLFSYQQGSNDISNNARDYAANEALWRATNATAAPTTAVVPGASGGGSTSIRPIQVISPLNDTGGAKAAAAARSGITTAYNVFGNLGHNT